MSAATAPLPERFQRLGMVARWKPVHLGHAAVIEALSDRADSVLLGIGSSNRKDLRNPFSAAETRDMIELVLAGRRNVRVIEVEDLGDGPRWRALVRDRMGPLDAFVTANPVVERLLSADYRIIHPSRLVPRERYVPIDGTRVRASLARGDLEWTGLVPEAVARYIREHGLDERFRREFGLATLALETSGS